MGRSIAGTAIQSVKQKKYSVLVIAILLCGVATIAAAQVESEVSPEDAEVLVGYLKEFAVPRWWLAFAAMFIAPWVIALTGLPRFGSAAISGKGPQMADHLRKVRILGSKYELDVYTGNVMSEKSWTVTTVDTTTTVGSTYSPSGSYYSPTADVSVTTTSVKYDQVRVGYPDRTRGSWEFANMTFVVAPGDIISVVARKVGESAECLLAYNHTSTQFVICNLRHAHAISRKLTWLILTVMGALGAAWGWSATIVEFVTDSGINTAGLPITPMGTTMWITAFVIGYVVAGVPLLVASLMIPRVRTRIFKATVMPGVKHFLQGITAEARSSFPLEWEGRVAPAG